MSDFTTAGALSTNFLACTRFILCDVRLHNCWSTLNELLGLYQIHPFHQVLDLLYDCNLFGRVKFVQLHCKRSLDDLRSLLLFLLNWGGGGRSWSSSASHHHGGVGNVELRLKQTVQIRHL